MSDDNDVDVSLFLTARRVRCESDVRKAQELAKTSKEDFSSQ